MTTGLSAFARQESGVASIEYALCAALIALVIFVAVGNVGNQVTELYEYVTNCVTAATSGSFTSGC